MVCDPQVLTHSSPQGNSSTSLQTDANGKRVRAWYECARYDPDAASWERDCKTLYNTASPADGVLCLCSHNTSFAVLMVRGYVGRLKIQIVLY